MPLVYKNLRLHQVYGANTDVGKTVLTTALALASAALGREVDYIKPVSTGPLFHADDQFVRRFTAPFSSRIHHRCLYQFPQPLSPHLAARLDATGEERKLIPDDDELISSTRSHIESLARTRKGKTIVFVETAGGVHSPAPSGVSQADVYRPLRLPVVLIADFRLGGISSTVASFESLRLRGYTVDAVLIFRDERFKNWEYLTHYFSEHHIAVAPVPPPPKRLSDITADFASMVSYYRRLTENPAIQDTVHALDEIHGQRIIDLQSLEERGRNHLWWPFVQHGQIKKGDISVIDSAYGDNFSTYRSQVSSDDESLLVPLFDGSASWWTQTFGHAHPRLALAAGNAAGRYGHVLFPQVVHEPAVRLAERLLRDGPGAGWASRVFFSDDGSTAMEVALKMALRLFCLRHGRDLDRLDKQALGILGLKGSYHGDTIGAMNACDAGDGVYTCEWHSAKGYWLDPPSVAIRDARATISLPKTIATFIGCSTLWPTESLSHIYNVNERLDSSLGDHYRTYIRHCLRSISDSGSPTLAALLLEPLVLGAGGMVFVDPLFQRILVDMVRGDASTSKGDVRHGLPVVFDEVFVGLYRVGQLSCKQTLGVAPDIAVYAKMLTGGLLPMAVTLANESVFEAFLSNVKADALLHGHSYTAYPVGCAVAYETLSMMESLRSSNAWLQRQKIWQRELPRQWSSGWSPWSFWEPAFLDEVSKLKNVDWAMTLGTVLAIRFKGTGKGYRSNLADSHLRNIRRGTKGDIGVHFRTLGDVAYFMTSLNTPEETVRLVERRIIAALR